MGAWLGCDAVKQDRWFSRASNVESMHGMVLHRPVELARQIRQVEFVGGDDDTQVVISEFSAEIHRPV
jgi:hypothetical protein